MELKDIIATILSVLAIAISAITFFSQKEFNKHSLRAVCKIDVNSFKGSIKIVFRNVGNGVMHIRRIYYKDLSNGQEIEVLSKWLNDIPCEMNSEENLDGTWIGASMSYNLLSRTILEQIDLDETWNRIKHLQINVEYEDTFGKKAYYKYGLETDYKIYSAAKGDRVIVNLTDKYMQPV